jgi:uncharacterized membrane protein YccC
MTLEFASTHWALLSASVLGLAVGMFVVWRVWLDSARGQLRAALRRLRKAENDVSRQQLAVRKSAATHARLKAKAESVKPSRLQEVAGTMQDAEALLKIATDQVVIARNHVRRIIVEEYPPKKHEEMRNKYLGQVDDKGLPFSF